MAKKNLWLGILVTMLVFAMTVVGCDDGSTDGGADTALNGTWITEDEFVELKFNNGIFEYFADGTPIQKGTYTTSGDKMTITTTHWNLSVTGTNWYSKAQMLAEAESAEEKASIEAAFAPQTGSYSINGNKFTFFGEGLASTYTRK